jgi:hypothetical protein
MKSIRNFVLCLTLLLITVACHNRPSSPALEIKEDDTVSNEEMIPEQQSIYERYDDVREEYLYFDETEHNYLMVKINGKTGMINGETGEVVVPLIYDELYCWVVYGELLIAEKEGKMGCIDLKGNKILSFVYDTLHYNDGENFAFCLEGLWGLVGPGDNILLPAQYDAIGYFGSGFQSDYNDLAPVKQEGKWGFINKNNELIVSFIYDSAEQSFFDSVYGSEIAIVGRGDKHYWIDKKGKEHLIPNYPEL